MSKTQDFNFNDDSIAAAYDDILVPIIFKPWAMRFIEENRPWEGRHVLDLAAGTGIVAQHLSEQVGPNGQVFAADINSEMLAKAAKRCRGATPPVKFIECPAQQLEIPGGSIDFVVCQQGFQFFPDKDSAVQEIFRVLRGGGQAVVSTWRPIEECQFFSAFCVALEAIGEQEISDMMRVPFDFMPETELAAYFESAGFINVQLLRQEIDLVIEGGITDALQIAYSTPIGPKLRDLPEAQENAFREMFTKLLNELCTDGITMGRMVTNVVLVEKPI